jgi:hypothetical protein
MGATIEDTLRLHAVTDNSAATMGAGWRQGMNGTLEAIENMRFPANPHFKTFVIHIATYFTSVVIPLLVHLFASFFCYPF